MAQKVGCLLGGGGGSFFCDAFRVALGKSRTVSCVQSSVSLSASRCSYFDLMVLETVAGVLKVFQCVSRVPLGDSRILKVFFFGGGFLMGSL